MQKNGDAFNTTFRFLCDVIYEWYPVTTHYHWPKFNEKATTGKNEGFEEVQGPFQFGLAVKVDKSKEQVFFILHSQRIFLKKLKL